VVGTDKSVEAPPGVSVSPRLFRRDVAVLRTTLSGLTGLSERSVRRRDDIGSSQPPRRFNDLEAFRRSARQSVRRPPGNSLGFVALSGFGPKCPPRSLRGPGRPSWGFLPLQRHRRRDLHDPGLPHPARSVLGVSHPHDGFFSLRPRGHARSAAAPGVPLAELFRARRPWCVAAPLHPLAYGARQPRTLRNTRSESSADSKMLEPALPWSHGRGSRAPESPSEHITPAPSPWLSPPQSPLALEPSASGRTMTRRTGTSGSFTSAGTSGSAGDPQLPWGFR